MVSIKDLITKTALALTLLAPSNINDVQADIKPITHTSETQKERDNEDNENIEKIYLTSCINNGTCSNNSKDVRLEDKVTLNLVGESHDDNGRIYFSEINNIEINGEKIESNKVRPWDKRNKLVRWYKIEPKDTNYNNLTFGRFAWDTPNYKETFIEKNTFIIKADAKPTNNFDNTGFGTMRFKVEFLGDNKFFSTPGKESVDKQGITEKVQRISFREDDTLLGWLKSYFNVPYIYGSAGKQPDNYIGADCADLVVAAYKKANKLKTNYTNAAGLVKLSKKTIDQSEIYTDGKNFYHKDKLLRFGENVNEGDLMLFGKDHIWHVGVLSKDKSDPEGINKGNSDKILNIYDSMIHTLFDQPIEENFVKYGTFSIAKLK